MEKEHYLKTLRIYNQSGLFRLQTSSLRVPRRLIIIISLSLTLFSCSSLDPLLTENQLAKQKYLKRILTNNKEQIASRTSDTNGLLVVVPFHFLSEENHNKYSLEGFDGDNTHDIAIRNHNLIKKGYCVYIHKKSLPLASEHYSCEQLVLNARKHIKFASDIESIINDITELEKAIDLISTGLAPAMILSKFNDERIDILENQINNISTNILSINENLNASNNLAAKLNSDLKDKFNQVKQKLDELTNKLNSI